MSTPNLQHGRVLKVCAEYIWRQIKFDVMFYAGAKDNMNIFAILRNWNMIKIKVIFIQT
jgi:hypothetical protein